MALINEDGVLIISDQHVDGTKVFKETPKILGEILEPKDAVTKEYLESVIDINTQLLLQDPVKGVVSALPSTPVEGDRYILSLDNLIYTYTAGTWGHEQPKNNMMLLNSTTNSFLFFNGLSWLSVGQQPAIATTTTPGVVQVGDGLGIDINGVLYTDIDPSGGLIITEDGLASSIALMGGSLHEVTAVLTAENIGNKYVDLDIEIPASIRTIAVLDSSPVMVHGLDYTITDDDLGDRKRVSWVAMPLAYFAEAGETIRIWY